MTRCYFHLKTNKKENIIMFVEIVSGTVTLKSNVANNSVGARAPQNDCHGMQIWTGRCEQREAVFNIDLNNNKFAVFVNWKQRKKHSFSATFVLS